MPKLKTEINTVKMESRVLEAAGEIVYPPHPRLQADFEHGQWWVTCIECGAQWSVCDCSGTGSVDGFCLEQVSNGDEWCD